MEILLSIDGIEYECVPKENKVIQETNEKSKIDQIITYFNKWDDKYELIRYILKANGKFNGQTIAYAMNCRLPEGIEVVSKLSQGKCTMKIGMYYTLTSFGKETLTREYLKDINYE